MARVAAQHGPDPPGRAGGERLRPVDVEIDLPAGRFEADRDPFAPHRPFRRPPDGEGEVEASVLDPQRLLQGESERPPPAERARGRHRKGRAEGVPAPVRQQQPAFRLRQGAAQFGSHVETPAAGLEVRLRADEIEAGGEVAERALRAGAEERLRPLEPACAEAYRLARRPPGKREAVRVRIHRMRPGPAAGRGEGGQDRVAEPRFCRGRAGGEVRMSPFRRAHMEPQPAVPAGRLRRAARHIGEPVRQPEGRTGRGRFLHETAGAGPEGRAQRVEQRDPPTRQAAAERVAERSSGEHPARRRRRAALRHPAAERDGGEADRRGRRAQVHQAAPQIGGKLASSAVAVEVEIVGVCAAGGGDAPLRSDPAAAREPGDSPVEIRRHNGDDMAAQGLLQHRQARIEVRRSRPDPEAVGCAIRPAVGALLAVGVARRNNEHGLAGPPARLQELRDGVPVRLPETGAGGDIVFDQIGDAETHTDEIGARRQSGDVLGKPLDGAPHPVRGFPDKVRRRRRGESPSLRESRYPRRCRGGRGSRARRSAPARRAARR